MDGPITSSTVSTRKSQLLSLPAEVLELVVDHIHPLRDLSHMCLTCKELNHCLLPRLYKDLQLSLRSDYAIIRRTETLLESEVVGLRYTKSLTIVNSSDRGEGVLEQGPEVNKAKTVDNVDRFFGRDQDPSLSTSLSLMLNCLIRLLLHRIPKHQLESFNWQHKQCLAPDTLTLLTKRHAKSLTGLGIGEVFQSFDGFPRWEELNNLFCHQVAEELMAHITCHNEENSSIKILTIGALTYRDVWGYYIKGTAASNAQDISGPNYYYVDYHKSLLGDWHYCLTRIGHGIPTGIAYFEPNLSIFEPYWLI